MINISQACEAKMDGTSGALYSCAPINHHTRLHTDIAHSIWFSALAQGLQASKSEVADTKTWAQALNSALEKLYTYTPARPPSRTLVDPLDAFVRSLASSSDVQVAAIAAAKAAEATSNLAPRAGRATYVESERLKGIMDPGAMGLKVILEAIARVLGA